MRESTLYSYADDSGGWNVGEMRLSWHICHKGCRLTLGSVCMSFAMAFKSSADRLFGKPAGLETHQKDALGCINPTLTFRQATRVSSANSPPRLPKSTMIGSARA